MPRYLSGIQPTSLPHLGNYFGAMEPHVLRSQMTEKDEALFFIADFHALTTVKDKDKLSSLVRGVAACYLALGLDHEKAIFFRQSDVPQVTELTWMLSCVTGMGLLERAHSYKDKTQKGITPSVGLFTYPILMASDILIYDADRVPVGKDQVQHIEMAQDMAGHFNHQFGGGDVLLKRPEWELSKQPKVPGTDGEKMSSSYGNFISILAQGKALKKQVNAIVTDSRPPPEPKDPDGVNAYLVLEVFLSDDEKKDWRQRLQEGGDGAPGYGDLKKEIMARMNDRFGPARERFAELTETDAGQKQLDDILEAGGARARAIASEVLRRCYAAAGIDNRG